MVLPGQYLERPTLIAREPATEEHSGITLEGLYHRGSVAPGVVVCAPHPRMGGSMDSPVVAELAWALTRAGHATLRFNYQGVGASGGEVHAAARPSEPQPLTVLDSEVGDAGAAVEHLRISLDHGKVAIAGYSFGAAVALSLALRSRVVTHLILVSPPTALFDFAAVANVTQPVMIAAGHHDAWVDRAFFGGLAQTRRNIAWEVIPKADHVYSQGLTELGRAVAHWLDASR